MIPLVPALDPRDPAAQFWLAAIGLVFTAAGAGWAAVRALMGSRRAGKRLSYQVVSDIGLINAQKDLGEDIRLTIDGHTVNDARLKVVKLANVGSEPVTDSDYHDGHPIRIEFVPPSLIRCAIHSTEPGNLIPEDRLKGYIRLGGADGDGSDARLHAFVDLPGLLLNRQEAVNLKFLTRGRPEMRVIGHIVGGKIQEYVPPPVRITRRTMGFFVLLGVLLGLLISNGIGVVGAFAQGNCALGLPVSVSGSTAFYSAAQDEANRYHASCPVAVFFVSSNSSGAGLREVQSGQVQVADSELTAAEAGVSPGSVADHPVAVIVFTVIVNPDVSHVSSLSRSQITRIYSGAIGNWSAVGGPDLPITVVGRPADSGTHEAFARFIIQGPLGELDTPRTHVRQRTAHNPSANPACKEVLDPSVEGRGGGGGVSAPSRPRSGAW